MLRIAECEQIKHKTQTGNGYLWLVRLGRSATSEAGTKLDLKKSENVKNQMLCLWRTD